jgi:hypothetical protein
MQLEGVALTGMGWAHLEAPALEVKAGGQMRIPQER